MQARRHLGLPVLLVLAGCSSSPPPRPLPPPVATAPTNTQVSLFPTRVIHAPWTAAEPAPLPRRLRGLNAVIAQPVLASTNDAVRACYTAMLAYNPQAGGTLQTLVRVNADGTVSGVDTLGTPDPSLALMQPCVLNALRSRRFPASRSASQFSFPFTFRSRGGTSPTPPVVAPPATQAGAIPVENPNAIESEGWRPTLTPNSEAAPEQTRDLAQLVIPDLTEMVNTCYAAALVMEPALAGNFTLLFGLEPSGTVNRVEVTDLGPLSPPVRDCVVALGRALRFHPARIPSTVSIPVTLAHQNQPPTAPTDTQTSPVVVPPTSAPPPTAPPPTTPTASPAPTDAPTAFGTSSGGTAPAQGNFPPMGR